MSEPAGRIIASILGCLCFGYAAVSCLLFAYRIRERALKYAQSPTGKHPLLSGKFVSSPQYIWTLWFAGAIGALGFAVSSWQLVLNVLALLKGEG